MTMRLTRVNKQVLEQLKNFKTNIDVNHMKNEYFYKPVTAANNWYTKIIGLDEVRLYQDRVVALQEKLLTTQEKRRNIAQELVGVRKKSNDLQEQLHKVKRQEDLQRFLELMRDETEVLKQEQHITRQFTDCDREEREIFTAFSNAIRDSHEKQRAQIEYSKYLSLILSLAGSFLVFVYSTLRKEDLKRFILENVTALSSTTLPTLHQLQENQTQLNRVVAQLNKDNTRLLRLVNGIHEEVRNSSKSSAFQSLRELVHTQGGDVSSKTSEYRDNSAFESSVVSVNSALKYGAIAFVSLIILRAMF